MNTIQFIKLYILTTMNEKELKMNDELAKLTKKIAQLRNQKGITQEKLAEMVEYSTNHISKLESCRTNPSFDLLVKISKALNIELKELFDFEEDMKIENYKEILHNILNSANDKQIKLLYNVYKAIEK